MERITIQWAPALVDNLRGILRQHRAAPRRGDVSTPELMQMALAEEVAIERDTLRKIARALAASQGELLDCGVIDAVHRLSESHRSMMAARKMGAATR